MARGDQLGTSIPRSLVEKGFAVIPMADCAWVMSAISIVEALGPAPDDGGLTAFSSGMSSDPGYRRSAATDVLSLLAAASGVDVARELRHAGMAERVPDRSSGTDWTDAEYLIIWPGPASGRPLASDGQSARLELAIDAADARNGRPWVVPFSHRWELAGSNLPMPEASALVGMEAAQAVDLGPGEALLCAPGLLRFSLPSEDRPRRCVTASLRNVDSIFDPQPNRSWTFDSLTEVGLVTDDPDRPRTAPASQATWCFQCAGRLEDDQNRAVWIEPSAIRCNACADRTADRDRHRKKGLASPPPPQSNVQPTRVLRRRRLDDRLRRDGFVVLPQPVITPEQARSLRSKFLELHGLELSGHLNDFNHRDLAYRAAATELMHAYLLEAIQAQFADFAPFLNTFLCKWGDNSGYLEPHQDWTYVCEEQGERAFLAFVALQPIGRHNGQIRVLRGSHRIDRGARGTGLRASWLRHSDVVERRFEPIRLGTGSCVVWDSATVHSSDPNTSDEPRVGAGLWMARRGARLVHCRHSGDGRVVRYQIDSEFYETQTPFRLMVAQPDYPVESVCELHANDIDASELARRLRASTRWRGSVQRTRARLEAVTFGTSRR